MRMSVRESVREIFVEEVLTQNKMSKNACSNSTNIQYTISRCYYYNFIPTYILFSQVANSTVWLLNLKKKITYRKLLQFSQNGVEKKSATINSILKKLLGSL